MNKVLIISSKKITWGLLIIISFLLAVNLFVIYFHFVKGHKYLRGFIEGFYFDNEANLPSLYSSLAILLSSVLFWRIASTDFERKEKRSGYWRFLSVVVGFLALDEFVSVHEYLFYPAQQIVAELHLQSDYFHFAWFVPYSILILIVGIVCMKFFFKLPGQTRILLTISGLVYLSGAVGMEMVSGKYWAHQGWAIDHTDDVDLTYALMVTGEELLEMLGIVVLISTLSKYYLKLTGEHSVILRLSDRTN